MKKKKNTQDEASMTHGGMGFDSKNFIGKADTSKMSDIGYEEEKEEKIRQMMEFAKKIKEQLKNRSNG